MRAVNPREVADSCYHETFKSDKKAPQPGGDCGARVWLGGKNMKKYYSVG